MRYIAFIALAAISFGAPAHAAASYEKVVEAVDQSAFATADEEWRRIVVNRDFACGAFGKDNVRRIDLIIDRYEQLAQAVASNDEAAAMQAGEKFASIVNANDRFAECWKRLSKRVGVSQRLAKMF